MARRSKPKTELDEQDELMHRLAGTISLLRKQKQMSLREFAELAGVDHSALFRLENGSTRNPELFLIRKLARVLGMSVDELMNFNAVPCPTCHGAGWVKGDK